MDIIPTQTSRNLYLWMMLWKNLDWVQMVLLSTAWSILVIWNTSVSFGLGSQLFSASVITIVTVCICVFGHARMPLTLYVQTSRRKFRWLVGRRVGKFCRRWLYCFWLPRYICTCNLCLINYCELFSLLLVFKTRTVSYKILNLVFWRYLMAQLFEVRKTNKYEHSLDTHVHIYKGCDSEQFFIGSD